MFDVLRRLFTIASILSLLLFTATVAVWVRAAVKPIWIA